MSGHPQWCFLRPALGVIAWLDPGFDDGRSYEWIDVVCSMWCQTWLTLVFPTGTFSAHALSQKWSVYLNELLYIENIHGPHWMNRTFPLSQPAGRWNLRCDLWFLSLWACELENKTVTVFSFYFMLFICSSVEICVCKVVYWHSPAQKGKTRQGRDLENDHLLPKHD